MKSRLLIFLLSVFTSCFAQSPLDYGKNKHFYYIAPSEIDLFGLDSLVQVTHRKRGDEGGMNENWDVEEFDIGFGSNVYSWSIARLGDTFHYSYDSLLKLVRYVNGSSLSGSSSAGGGYGTFSNSDVFNSNDTCTLSVYYLTGHCANHCGVYAYSKIVYDTNGRIKYKVFYPDQENYQEGGEEYNLDPEEIGFTITGFESAMKDQKKVITYFLYDKAGHLVHLYHPTPIPDPISADVYFQNGGLFAGMENYTFNDQFHQVYVRGIPIEKVIKKRIGYYPEIILLGINDYSVVPMIRDKKDHRYHIISLQSFDDCSSE